LLGGVSPGVSPALFQLSIDRGSISFRERSPTLHQFPGNGIAGGLPMQHGCSLGDRRGEVSRVCRVGAGSQHPRGGEVERHAHVLGSAVLSSVSICTAARFQRQFSAPGLAWDLLGRSAMSKSARSRLAGIALLDTPVTPRLRVRSWHHRFGPTELGSGSHAFVEVAWVLEGAVTYRVGDRDIVVESGRGIVIPARVEHATRVSPGSRAGSAWIASEQVSGVAASLGRRAFAEATLLGDASDLARLGALLESEAEEARAGQLLAAEALAEALVVAIVRRAPAAVQSPSDPRLGKAIALIESQYAESLGVDALSRAAGISRFHFSRMFRDALGMSPYQYLQRVRLERARELLLGGNCVTDAALSVGFRDLGRFARAFREEFGCAPSDVGPARIAARSARSA
jgi:AraC-like DNA-binding protein